MNRRQFLGLFGLAVGAAVTVVKQQAPEPVRLVSPPPKRLVVSPQPLRGTYAGWVQPGVP